MLSGIQVNLWCSMRRIPNFALCVFGSILLLINVSSNAAEPKNAKLRAELLEMKEQDQQVRKASSQEDFRRWLETDARNLIRLKEIIAEYGWPTNSLVGKDGAQAAWILAQHADGDREFQINVVRMMEPLIEKGEASKVDYAYLYDRTHYPQRFGTQGDCVNPQEWQPFAIEDIDRVDERRRELNLPSMADYAKRFDCAGPYTAYHSPSDSRKTVPVPKSHTMPVP